MRRIVTLFVRNSSELPTKDRCDAARLCKECLEAFIANTIDGDPKEESGSDPPLERLGSRNSYLFI